MKTSERFLQRARDAESQAADLLLLTPELPADRTSVLERVSFHYGQASGFRQAAYYAMISEGTNARD